jgi:hypothetical protein
MAIVYIHKTLDTNEVFYVGIGKNKSRAFSTSNRNKHWNNIVKKHGFYYDIVFEDLTWEDCCKLEIQLISEYGRKIDGGLLCNISLGGDGVLGLVHSKETREKMSKSRKGIKFSDDHRRKISEANKLKNLSEETLLKRKRSLTGKVKSLEVKMRISKIKTGSKHTDETKEKLRKANSLSSHPQAKTILNVENGVFYESLTEACFYTGISIGSFYGKRTSDNNFRLVYTQ